MSSTKERPVFHIVEGVKPDVDYESFKKDFLDPNQKVDDIKEKYNLSPSDYMEYRNRVLDETGLSKKPAFYGRDITIKDETYITRRYNGYDVFKHINGKYKFFGKYKDLGTARLVRDKLLECDWDEEVAEELKKKYLPERVKPSRNIAVQRFDEFDDLYMNSSHTIKEIKEIMGISNSVYSHLLVLMKEKYGKLKRSGR